MSKGTLGARYVGSSSGAGRPPCARYLREVESGLQPLSSCWLAAGATSGGVAGNVRYLRGYVLQVHIYSLCMYWGLDPGRVSPELEICLTQGAVQYFIHNNSFEMANGYIPHSSPLTPEPPHHRSSLAVMRTPLPSLQKIILGLSRGSSKATR